MKINLPPFVRFLIAAAIMAAYFVFLVQFNAFDGLIRFSPVLMYLVAAIVGASISAVTYALLPTKKTIRASEIAFKDDKRRQRAIGYWTWILCGIIFIAFWTPFYIAEM